MSWTNISKSSSSWASDTKHAATFTNISKNTTEDSFLLKEDTFYLLLETGDKLALSYGWTNLQKH